MWFAQQIIMSLIQLTAWICELTCFLRRVCVRLCGAAGNWTGLLRWGFSFLKNIPVYGWCQRGALIKTLLLKWKREISVLQTYINTTTSSLAQFIWKPTETGCFEVHIIIMVFQIQICGKASKLWKLVSATGWIVFFFLRRKVKTKLNCEITSFHTKLWCGTWLTT